MESDNDTQADRSMTQITIVVPVFNEEKGLNQTIRRLERLLDHPDYEFNVIFVDDGSTDESTALLDAIQHPSMRVIHHTCNRGYGASLKTGIGESLSPYVCIADADGTYPLEEIITLSKHIESGYSMVVGARIGEDVKIPLIRKFPKWLLGKLANYLTCVNIPDINSGLRVMKKDDVLRFARILPDGFSFTTTITLAMLTNNLSVLFIPINYLQRKGKSKIRPIYDTLNFIQLIIRTCLYFDPLRIFIPFTFFLLILAFLVLIISYFVFGRFMDVTFGVILMTAVTVAAIGMLADLIDKRLG